MIAGKYTTEAGYHGALIEWGAALRRWRVRGGLSLDVLAARVGVVADTVQSWEQGKSAPFDERAARIVALGGPAAPPSRNHNPKSDAVKARRRERSRAQRAALAASVGAEALELPFSVSTAASTGELDERMAFALLRDIAQSMDAIGRVLCDIRQDAGEALVYQRRLADALATPTTHGAGVRR